MGSDHSQENHFQKQEWDLVERNSNHQLWRSRKDPGFHVEQYDIYTRDSHEQSEETQSFKFRYRQPRLVSSIFYKGDEEHEFCSSNHTNSLFLQKIPIRLSDIEHIPHPDTLHLYFQALLGFQTISNRYGYFEIQEEHIGVNEKAVVKVWCNRDFSKSFITGGKISQEQMVKSLIDILDKNCDPNLPGNVPSLRNYLYRNADTLTFNQALQELKSYSVNYNNGYIPERLECVQRVGGIYAIANRISSQTDSPQTGRSFQPDRTNQGNINYPGYERPRITSDHSLSSEQSIRYGDSSANRQVTSQFNLKASEAIPTATREKVIINPTAYREDVQIVRKRRSDFEMPRQISGGQVIQQIQGGQAIQINPMKYSQTVQPVQPPEFRILQSPVKSSQINFSTQPPQQELRRVPSEQNQLTFKAITNQPREFVQPLQMGNTSIANYSLGPSQPSTHRGDKNVQILQGNLSNQSIQSSGMQKPQVQIQRQQQLVYAPLQGQVQVQPSQKEEVQQKSQIPDQQVETKKNSEVFQSPIQNTSIPQQMQSPRKEEVLNFQKGFQPQKLPLATESPPSYPSPAKPSNFKPIVQPLPQSPEKPQQEISNQNSYNSLNSGTSYSKSNYQAINPDDGKSSEEFMKKLKEITQGISSYPEIKTQNNKSEPTYQASAYSSTNKPAFLGAQAEQKNFSAKYSYQEGSIQPTSIRADDDDFGRIAVSNIIESHQSAYSKMPAFNNEPLRFENNLAMKYSVLQGDEPEKSNVSKGTYGKYELNLDADLMADLKKIKE